MSDDDARIKALERRLSDAEERTKRALDLAEKATRVATASITKLDGISAGLISHLERLADDDKRQREAGEAVRQAAAAAHKKRFEEQGRAIELLTEHVRARASRDERGRWILGAVIAVITVLGNQAVEAVKIIYGTPAHEVATSP